MPSTRILSLAFSFRQALQIYQTVTRRISSKLRGRTVIADENYIRESILDPPAKVVSGFEPIIPTFPGLGEEDVNALVEYVKSLNPKPTDSQTSSIQTSEIVSAQLCGGGIRLRNVIVALRLELRRCSVKDTTVPGD